MLCKAEEIIVDTEYNSDEADENIRLTLEDSGGESYHQSSYQQEQHHSSPRQRNVISVARNLITQSGKSSSKSIMENEKRMRREIANSNERRRMQSINAGFQSLRSLLPHHEGEKLSKAAILQQTAQYILDLEREKTHLLSQNSQLKRLLGQHEMGGTGGGGGGTETNAGPGAIKKRKLTDNVMTMQAISDSSDEGLGSMSPEPVTLLSNGTKTSTYISSSTKEMNELKARYEAERKRRSVLEERLRQLERQIYPNQYIQREVIEHTDNLRDEEVSLSIINDPLKLQVVEIDSLPTVGQTQVVVCSSLEEMQEEEVETITDELVHANVREEVIIPEDTTEYVEVPSRLQPILEAAIKAEPKVEVERINATLIKAEPNAVKDGKQGNGRMYLTSTSRQNLETIVEAIRHLEGDHLFGDMVEQKKAQQQHSPQQKPTAQEVPLALTNKPQQRKLPVELSPFLQLKKQNNVGNTVTIVGTTPKVATTATIPVVSNSSSNSSNNSSSSSNIKGTSSNSTSSNVGGSNTSTVKTATLVASSNTAQTSVAAPQKSATIAQGTVTQVTLTPASHKQCRPGVIVAKQIS